MRRVFKGTCVVLFLSVGALCAADNVEFGTIELKGATEKKFVTAGNNPKDFAATLKNKLGNGKSIDDLTVEVRQATAADPQPDVADVTVSNGDHEPKTLSGGSLGKGEGADFTSNVFPGSIGGDSTCEVDIDMTSYGDCWVYFTPTSRDKPKGSDLDASLLEDFDFETDTDLIRHGTSAMYRDRLAFNVSNEDEADSIIQLEATVTFPVGSSASVSSVYLQDPSSSYNPVQGTTVSINGNEFTLSGFQLEASRCYEVVVVFSEAFDGDGVRVALEATFD